MAARPPVGRDLLPGRPTARQAPHRRPGTWWRALTLALLVAAAALPVARQDEAGAAGGRPAGPLVPAAGFYVGAYTKSVDGYSEDKQRAAIEDLESHLGRRLHIDHHFYDWSKEFPSQSEPWDIQNGRIPMISWNGAGVASSAIAAGAYDGMIISRADAVKALGEPVFIRWFWEMDGNKKAQWAEGPANYTAAWRRIVDLFRARGATNAVWVWCPNASAFDDGKAQAFYPGANYVDWICADGYNFAPNRPGDRWRNFDEIFVHFYEQGAKLNKPMMIGEFGVLERDPGEKGAWFHYAHDVLAQKYPAIAALVYFNADSTTNGVYFDWRVKTSPESYEGFRYLFTGPAPVPQAPPATSPPATSPPVTTPATSPPTTAA
ncbi:MAG: glycoside hydrolase family 26 protein, partial [Acidimicrobiia bacterium]